MYEMTDKVLYEIKKVIAGKDEVIKRIWMAILAKGHVLLDDVPGVGKTTMAMAFAAALGLDARRIQFTPDTMPSDITGFSFYDNGNLKVQQGAVMTNMLLADEINRTSAKTQSSLLEAMEEGRVTVDGKTYPLPEPFVVLATQNPVGSIGTQLLPESQLDRFLFRLHIGYPDHEAQINLMKARHTGNPLEKVEAVTDIEGLMSVIQTVEKTHISDIIYDYIATLCEASRSHEMVTLGVSPRASLALCRASKARAFLAKRDYVIPEDVRDVANDVFAHRIVLSSRARLNEYTAELVTDDILKNIQAPPLTENNA